MITKNNPLDTLYQLRSRSIVIALTGVTGSGCTTIAEIMSMSFNDLNSNIRSNNDIQKYSAHGNMREERFKREYSICYNYCAHNYDDNAKFKVIRYRNVLLYCVIKYIIEKKSEKNIVSSFISALNDLLIYQKGKENERELLSLKEEVVVEWGLNESLLAKFEAIRDPKLSKNDYRRLTYNLFYSEPFSQFCENLYDYLKERDYFAKNYLVHKLACAFRGHGSPERTYPDGEFDNLNVYHVVTVINDIIKGAKYQDVPVLTHFVIDSIRNSIELAYLRERYHSFYSVAVHNIDEELVKKMIRSKVQKKMRESDEMIIDSQVESILNINTTEEKVDDFENGRFYSPDIARCVAESEMHFCYRESFPEKIQYSFYSNGEQWLRFISLILRPGIVSPTRDERCMAIAYVAKFNSGCISRQVGCAIVDDNYLFKSIGWNDPPAGQLPCSLRSVVGLLNTDPEDNNYRCYSCFEQSGTVPKTNRQFSDFLKDETKNFIGPISESGLSYPYCFSSRYNRYYGEKDKVNTRSLHAEENAILRLREKVEGGQMFVTASPCVLCSKKAYQIGIKRIVFLDPYSDIAPMHIIQCGDNSPALESFMGAIGETYYRLYRPYLPYKDELSILESAFAK